MIRYFSRVSALLVAFCGMAPMTQADTPRPLTLVFTATADGAPMVFDQFAYADPVGGEPVRLRDFRFYLSNLVFRGPDGQFAVPDSYHLVRFDARSGVHSLTLPDVPLDQITQVDVSIGLDPDANGSIMPRGDVDPNSRMAWNWRIGYKFVLVEGALRSAEGLIPLVYHVGFNENRRDQTHAVSVTGQDREIAFDVDVLSLFSGPTQVDLSALPTVKMDRGDAAMLADNFAGLLQVTD